MLTVDEKGIARVMYRIPFRLFIETVLRTLFLDDEHLLTSITTHKQRPVLSKR